MCVRAQWYAYKCGYKIRYICKRITHGKRLIWLMPLWMLVKPVMAKNARLSIDQFQC